MRTKMESIATVAVLVAAGAVAIAAVRLFLFPPVPQGGRIDTTPPERLGDAVWEEILSLGILVGDTSDSPPITVVEFLDIECPFCRQSHLALAEAKKALPDSVAHIVVHYPLDFHRFGVPAARAAECAGVQDRFSDFLNLALEKQDSLGLKTWASYAVESGVRDTLRFNECNASKSVPSRVELGLEMGNRIGVRMTPTVLVNGWLLSAPPRNVEEYVRVVREVVAGEEPYAR